MPPVRAVGLGARQAALPRLFRFRSIASLKGVAFLRLPAHTSPPFPRIDFSKGENNCYSNRTLQPRTDLPKVCVPTYERLWIPPTIPYRFKETAVAAGCQATCAAARVSVGKA